MSPLVFIFYAWFREHVILFTDFDDLILTNVGLNIIIYKKY